MRVVGKTSAGAALILVALLLCCVGATGALALAQYDVPTEDQYAPPPANTAPLPEDQYASPPAGTTPTPEDQYDAPPEDQNTTGNSTVPADNDGNGNDGAAEADPPDRPSPASGIPEYLDGFLLEGGALLVVLSLITTLFFFLERSSDRTEP